MKKKSGFTIIEMVLVLALTSIIVTITASIYVQNNRIQSEVNIKSDLQSEAQNIAQKISNAGMQASGVSEMILLNDATNVNLYSKPYSEITLVDSTGKIDSTNNQNNQWISVKQITINDKYESITTTTNADGTQKNTIEITDTPFVIKNSNRELSISSKTDSLSKNVDNVLIRPSNLVANDNSINGNNKICDAASIEININFAKSKGVSNVKYSIPIKVTFRNKQ